MKRYIVLLLVIVVVFVSIESVKGEEMSEQMQPPAAKVIPKKLEMHGDVRVDNYYWLRERDNPDVIAYLEAENAYVNAMMKHTKGLEDQLFEEIRGRIKQDDESVPYKLDDYYYYTRYEDGRSYPIHCRKKQSLDEVEEVILDVNVLADGHEFFVVGNRKISSDQNILAFAEDTRGRRIYTIRFKNLTTGEMLGDVIPETTSNFAWASDNKTFFYTKQDPTTLRYHRIYRHELGTDAAGDQLVFEETDEEFSCYVWRSKSKRYMFIGSYQTLSTEYLVLDANEPHGDFEVFQTREPGHEYDVDHLGDKFYIRSNDDAQNFRLMQTEISRTNKKHWEELIPHREDVYLERFNVFEQHLVVEERKDGLIQIRIRPWTGSAEHYLEFDEPAYVASMSDNYDTKTTKLRFVYESLVTPMTTYDYDMVSQERELLKQDEVLGGFESSDYKTERLYATARDGSRVPISIVYRRGMQKTGDNPLFLYGYGSYGYSMDAWFIPSIISLLDRGFTYAIAHIRGGQELGREWYEGGKLLEKKNTFTDFIDCAEYLVADGYTQPDRLFAAGGSAGGLLMGAIMNMRPDLFEGVVTRVPFVDVVTTMLDETIPLTTSEYDEWGDPNEKQYYDYMLSYSPYDNVEAKDYPNLLVTTGLHDSQVQYWEPAKWVAKLRAVRTGDNRLFLKTNMDAGHSGASGRYKRYRETAFQYAFLLDLIGYTSSKTP